MPFTLSKACQVLKHRYSYTNKFRLVNPRGRCFIIKPGILPSLQIFKFTLCFWSRPISDHQLRGHSQLQKKILLVLPRPSFPIVPQRNLSSQWSRVLTLQMTLHSLLSTDLKDFPSLQICTCSILRQGLLICDLYMGRPMLLCKAWWHPAQSCLKEKTLLCK